MDFSAGEYILICFVGDAIDAKPHLAHGMARQFTVEPLHALDLRGSGVSLTGEWASGELTGRIRGARRR